MTIITLILKNILDIRHRRFKVCLHSILKAETLCVSAFNMECNCLKKEIPYKTCNRNDSKEYF